MGGDPGTIGEHLTAAHAALVGATEWLLAAPDVDDRLAGASPYLRMFGIVAGGRYLAQSAVAARRQIDARGDDEFLLRKIATAGFYAKQILPHAAGLLPAVTSGAADLDVERPGVAVR